MRASRRDHETQNFVSEMQRADQQAHADDSVAGDITAANTVSRARVGHDTERFRDSPQTCGRLALCQQLFHVIELVPCELTSIERLAVLAAVLVPDGLVALDGFGVDASPRVANSNMPGWVSKIEPVPKRSLPIAQRRLLKRLNALPRSASERP